MTTQAYDTVIVTDGDQRAALAVVRSLGQAGHTIHVCAHKPASIAGGSKYATSERVVADALTEPDQFVQDVRAFATEVGATVIIPITEASLIAILPQRHEAFAGITIPFVEADMFREVSNKAEVLTAAQGVGISIPGQRVLQTPDDVAGLPIETLSFPIVVKPSRSVAGAGHQQTKFVVQHAADARDLRRILTDIDARAYPLLLQQRIVGPGVGIFVLVWKGTLVAAFSHRRIREHPPAGGVSVYRESFPLDDVLLQQSLKLLKRFCWEGVAMIEYKVDAATKTPYLMEINGRFWGSLQLAIDAGVNFPVLLLQAAAGQAPATVTTYNTKVRSRWEWGDMNHLIVRLSHSNRFLALPPNFPGRLQTFFALFCYHPHNRWEIFRRDDPQPFFRETVQWFRDLRET